MSEKRALGIGATCCGECELCCCPPTVEGSTTVDEFAAELDIDLEEEDDE